MIVALSAALATVGWQLKNAWQANGSYKAEVKHEKNNVQREKDLTDQWIVANNLSIEAFNNQKAKHEAAEQRLIDTAKKYQALKGSTNELRTKIKQLEGDNLDSDLGDDFWLHIKASAANARATTSVPGN